MRHVSISELKAKLSQFLDLVKGGEEVIVTDRGRPVARLGPLGGEKGRSGRLEHLIRLGRVRPPLGEPPDLSRLERPADPDGRALEVVLEERRTGR